MSNYRVVYTDRQGILRQYSAHRLKKRAQESLKEAKMFQPTARITSANLERIRGGELVRPGQRSQENNSPINFGFRF